MSIRRLTGAAILPALAAVALLGAACSKGASAGTTTPAARPNSPAKLQIVSPTNGDVIHGSTVHVKLSLQNAQIVQATTKDIRPDQGHVHVFLDDQIVSMNYSLDDTIANVKPGTHLLRVEFVASDHLPFDPRVFAAVTFEVKR